MPDLRVEHHGSIVLLIPVSDAGAKWVDHHVHVENWQYWGGGVASPTRYVADIVEGARNDGLEVD